MSDDFIRFKSMDGEVYISKSSISSIKQLRTQNLPQLVSDNSDRGYATVDKNYDYIEITLKELDEEGHNVTIRVKSDLDGFIERHLK